MSPHHVSESELHAYVDGELPAARRQAVEAHLAAHPHSAERVRAYAGHKQALKALFDPVLDEPLPPSLQAWTAPPAAPHATNAARPWWPQWSLQHMAASVLIALVSGTGGWALRGGGPEATPPAPLATVAPLPRQAAIAHVVYSPDVRRPVEIGAEHEDQLVAWLSKRLGTAVHPPKLGAQGYELIGGRLLPGNHGPVAQFMYHDASGQRLTLYVSTEIPHNQDTGFRFAQEGPVSVFYWVDGPFGYALSAGIGKAELAQIATAVYDQLEHR